MLLERELKMTSPLLAVKMNNKLEHPRREFVKTAVEGGFEIRSDLARWNWAFLEARDSMGLEDVVVSAIIPGATYFVSGTSTYNRTFRRGKEKAQDAFEAISSGRVIKCRFTLSKHMPPDSDSNGRFDRVPDEEEFDAMLTHIGENLGMSEWGHAYLYGRFQIKPKTNVTDP